MSDAEQQLKVAQNLLHCYNAKELSNLLSEALFLESEAQKDVSNLREKVEQPQSVVVSEERGTNEYGLDVGYFSNLFNRELSSIRNFRPDELARVLARAAKTADATVLLESEFQPTQDGHK